ncbi:MAG: TIGR02444 family protein [Pseudomonadota bacterium]|nr:TIGR02444 family protein [Pseudomonadota bacterium]
MSTHSATAPDSSTLPLDAPADLETDNPLWRFALAFWQQPEVEDSCLALQAQGWSVTRLLCAAWLSLRGKAYTGAEDATVTEWRRRVTGALRSARKTLPANLVPYRGLRSGLAALELEAEQIELALAWKALTTDNPDHADMQGSDTLIRTNLTAAAPASPVEQRALPMIHTLAGALAQLSMGDHKP